jgi:protein ImuB
MSPRPLPESSVGSRILRLPGRSPPLREIPPFEALPEQEAPELWLAAHLSGCQPRELERLAARAQRFTPRVCLAPPDGLLLEVKGSLHLFGGLDALVAQVVGALMRADEAPQVAVAPVSRAALTAARAGAPLKVTSLARLNGPLAPLPLLALGWPSELLERLSHVGVRSIGQALRLPRAGFARRFGVSALRDLEQLVGREPDLREVYEARAGFRRRRELLHEIEDHERLLAALAPLFTQLDQFLTTHQLAVLELTCLLWHRQGEPGRCTLRLAAPSMDAGRLATLLGERLSRQ